MRKANNPHNLVPFPKGTSGNLKGRPKKMPGVDQLLAEVITENDRRCILKRLVLSAKRGNLKSIEILLDRLYGKAKQSTEISGAVQIQAITGMIIEKDDT
jgi:hypothetical protein